MLTEYGVNFGPNKAIPANRMRKTNPVIANLLLTSRRHASCQYEREGRETVSAISRFFSFHLNHSSGTRVGFIFDRRPSYVFECAGQECHMRDRQEKA